MLRHDFMFNLPKKSGHEALQLSPTWLKQAVC